MNIISMTTWGIRCGVASYSRNLNMALRNLGTNITIWGNIPSGKNAQDRLMEDDAEFKVDRNWSVYGWSGNFDRPIVDGIKSDIWSCQYESFLYDMRWFPGLVRELKEHGVKIVVTYHSAGIPPGFPADCIDLAICHTQEIYNSCPGRQRELLEMPGPYRRPRVGTFGLGRSNTEWLAKACQELDWEFVNLVHVNGDWVPQDRLIDDLRTCDVLALPYHAIGTSVSSSAARLALATYRPVVVSDTNWFSTIPAGVAIKHPYTYEGLKTALEQALPNHRFIREHGWPTAARAHLRWYRDLAKIS